MQINFNRLIIIGLLALFLAACESNEQSKRWASSIIQNHQKETAQIDKVATSLPDRGAFMYAKLNEQTARRLSFAFMPTECDTTKNDFSSIVYRGLAMEVLNSTITEPPTCFRGCSFKAKRGRVEISAPIFAELKNQEAEARKCFFNR